MTTRSNGARHDRAVVSKGSLTAASHALENTALQLGESAVFLSTFQYDTYFEKRAHAYEALTGAGVATAVAYAGDEPLHDSHVTLDPADPLMKVWSAVLVSDSLCGYVYATDQERYGSTHDGLEPARLFRGELGFGAARAREHADALLDEFDRVGLDDAAADAIRSRLDRMGVDDDASAVSSAWEAGMRRLIREVEQVNRGGRNPFRHAMIDPLTGLPNRHGVRHWSGELAGVQVPNPPVGAVMLRLRDLEAVDATLGDDAGDELLSRVAFVASDSVRSDDLVARWNVDQLVLLCPGEDDLEALEDIAERVADAARAVSVEGHSTNIDVAIEVSRQRPFDFWASEQAVANGHANGQGSRSGSSATVD